MTAREALDAALVVMASNGRRPRCADPEDHELWTSDDHTDRARAARLCRGCEVLAACGAAAQEAEETHHVWGGTDRATRRKTA